MDAYGESEQRVGLLAIIEQHLACPFETEILGAAVLVERVDVNDEARRGRPRVVDKTLQRDGGADGIVAICRRGRAQQRISILNLPLPSPPPIGWEWIAASGHWARGGR